jgi:hypothetical protein
MRERSQSTVVGFVLVFAILLMLLVTIQTTAVPAWNQGVEYSHSERVQGELELLRDTLFRTAATGSVGSKSVSLGTQYPLRPFLFNPPDPTGRLRTTAPGTVTITNATAPGETRDYWNGSTRSFVDRALVYRPDYNEYDTAPTTALENTVSYNRFDQRALTRSGQRLVSGRRINVVALNGTLDERGQRPETVETEPLSAPTQTTTVRSDGPLVVTATTRLSEAVWEELLAEERAPDGYVTDVAVTPGDPGTLRLTLAANESYDLRMAKIGVGSNVDDPPAHYITTDSPSELRLAAGGAERLVFEVRDRFNNPVSGVAVDATPSGSGTLIPVDNVTDSDGHARFRYEADAVGTATVTATFGTDPDPMQTATVTVESRTDAGTTGGTGPAGGGDDIAPSVSDIETNATTATARTVERGTKLALSATVSDFERGGSDVYRATWSSNRSTAGGAMRPEGGDGEFDSVEERVVAGGIDTSGWATGWHNITVTGTDANGNVGTGHYAVRITDGTVAPGVTYVDGTASVTGNRFALDIAVDGTATLERAAVNTTAMPRGMRTGLDSIVVDETDRFDAGTYASDGTLQTLQPTALSGTSTVVFERFNANGQNLPGGDYRYQSTQPAREHVSVTFEFSDGSTQRLYFTPPPATGGGPSRRN